MTTYDLIGESLHTRESLRAEALAWRKRYMDERSMVATVAAENDRLKETIEKLREECQRLTAQVREWEQTHGSD